jgi:NAD binding domain of 6-phosphogluconate dehydrogenase
MTDTQHMKLGMVGLGRMGSNMARRLLRAGHQCRVYDRSEGRVNQLVGEGAEGAGSLAGLVARLDPPRTVWLMLPAAVTGSTVTELLDRLEPGDTIVDGGNSSYRDDIDRGGRRQPGDRLPRLRHQRRRLRARARLLPDDRGPGAGLPAPRADLRDARSRGRRGRENSGPRRRPFAR